MEAISISKESVQPLFDIFNVYKFAQKSEDGSPVLSIELGDGNGWNTTSIYRLQSILRKVLEESLQPETLIIGDLHIVGTETIETFCTTNSLTSLSESKLKKCSIQRLQNAELTVIDIPCKVVFFKEFTGPVSESDMVLDTNEKHFHITRKCIYELNSEVNVIIEAIKKGSSAHTLLESGALSSAIEFHIHLEIRKSAKNELSSTISSILQHIIQMSRLLNKTPLLPLQEAEAEEVKKSYQNLIRSATGVSTAPLYFFAPKPITLEQKNLYKPGYGVSTIQEGYAVTEKADGERLLLFIHPSGTVYLINNVLQVFETGFKVPKRFSNSLLDGEFVSWDRRLPSTDKDLFAVFDAYIYHNKTILTHGLFERMKIADDIAAAFETEQPLMDMMVKKHRAPTAKETIFDVCNTILSGSHPYHVDGLIFTPVDIPVFAYYPKQAPQLDKLFYRSARWDRLLKWKPSDQNTIDFLVKDEAFVRDPVTQVQYKAFTLYNGQRQGKYKPKTILENLRGLQGTREKVVEVYEETPFRCIENYIPGMELAKIPLDMDGRALDSMGQPIENNMIVEFAYDTKLKLWSPLRIRDDKTRMYRQTNNISGAANDYEVARNIWRSIHNPVTQDMIVGTIEIADHEVRTEGEEALTQDGVYYAREVPREYSLSLQMLEFHNLVIKAHLYQAPPKRRRLLELACGKAGDLRRWDDARYQLVVGIDISRDNIVNPMNGAYSRVLNPKKYVRPNQQKSTYVFLVGDVAEPLQTSDKVFDKESEGIWNTMLGKKKPTNADTEPLYGIMKHGFDVVSCQFAIHYFYKDEKCLRNFLSNVSMNLSKGGVFVGTCMDGRLVDELCNENQLAEGRKEGVALWAIQRKYKLPIASPYGNKIDVYLEMTQQIIPEYLVNFEHLIKMASEYKLRLVASELFKTTLHNCVYEDHWPIRPTAMLRNSLEKLANDPVLLKFSALNRWFIFEKQ